jgi:hypothetical protein
LVIGLLWLHDSIPGVLNTVKPHRKRKPQAVALEALRNEGVMKEA